jgi:REP element-mobilizing transposase RayT
MPDHVHILIGLKPKALSDLVRDIKANSSRFNEKHG